MTLSKNAIQACSTLVVIQQPPVSKSQCTMAKKCQSICRGFLNWWCAEMDGLYSSLSMAQEFTV